MGLLDARSNPNEAGVLQAEDGATLDTLRLPVERTAVLTTPDTDGHRGGQRGTEVALNSSTELAAARASSLHSELALALRAPVDTGGPGRSTPLGSLDAGDSNGRTAFVPTPDNVGVPLSLPLFISLSLCVCVHVCVRARARARAFVSLSLCLCLCVSLSYTAIPYGADVGVWGGAP